MKKKKFKKQIMTAMLIVMLVTPNLPEVDLKISKIIDEMNTNGNTSIIDYTFELNFRGRAKETEEQGDPISNYFDHYINSSSDDYLHWQIINTGKIKSRRNS